MLSNIDLVTLTAIIVPLVFAITLHEAAHAWSALKLGDDTANRLGRVTLNPFPHIDPLGTIILPLMLHLSGSGFIFGWAKPVPVQFGRLGTKSISMRYGIVLVALAGPVSNLVMALFFALLSHLILFAPEAAQPWLIQMCVWGMIINILLAVFNMIPIPPLDGGRIAVGLLPGKYAWQLARLERFGFLIILALLIFLPMIGEAIGVKLDFFSLGMSWIRDLVTAPFVAISAFS